MRIMIRFALLNIIFIYVTDEFATIDDPSAVSFRFFHVIPSFSSHEATTFIHVPFLNALLTLNCLGPIFVIA